MRRSFLAFVLAGLMVCVTASSASAAVRESHKTSTKSRTTSTTSSVAVRELPVVSCDTSYADGSDKSPFVADDLATTTTAHGLSFYSNGLLTVLGPSGWTCAALVAGDGGQSLVVYPAGAPNYADVEIPKGAAVVQVLGDYTGHIPGADMVCGLFPKSAAATYIEQGGETCPTLPAGQKAKQLTPDVVTFSDSADVVGSAAGSGGSLTSTGAIVYPQLAFDDQDSVNITQLSCTLPKKLASVCSAITGDFVVRNPPSYVPQASN